MLRISLNVAPSFETDAGANFASSCGFIAQSASAGDRRVMRARRSFRDIVTRERKTGFSFFKFVSTSVSNSVTISYKI